MNILMLDLFGSFQTGDLHYFFQKMGNKCKYIQYLLKDKNGDDTFEGFLVKELNSNSFDVVFSTNYYPAVARVCYRMNIPYCSWTYDSPPEITSLDTMDYPTNRIFFFSKYDYSVFADGYGLENVYYLPLAVNTKRLENIKPARQYASDVALVGGLYKSDSFLGLKSIMSATQQQYVDAVIAVQLEHSGSGVIDASLTDEFVEGVCAYYKSQSPTAIQPTKEQLFYSFCSHITHMDRLALLRLSAQKGYHTRLYLSQLSNQDRVLLEKYNVELMGNVSYEEEVPQVFKSTKINLILHLELIELEYHLELWIFLDVAVLCFLRIRQNLMISFLMERLFTTKQQKKLWNLWITILLMVRKEKRLQVQVCVG